MKDPLAVGLGALASGAGMGGATIVAALAIVRLLVNYQEIAADSVLGGAFAGLAVAAAFGWVKSRGLDNIWQRGVIAVMATVGALLVGFLAWPVHRWLGIPGLVGWGVASFAVAVAASRWARRGSREDAIETGGTAQP